MLSFFQTAFSGILGLALTFVLSVGPSRADESPVATGDDGVATANDNTLTFRGRCVETETGEPIAGAYARFYPQRLHSSRNVLSGITQTDDEGRFVIEFEWDAERTGEQLDFAQSRIVVSAKGRVSRVVLCGNTSTERQIKLDLARSISGRVTDKNGQGIRDAIVRLGRHATPGFFDARTDADGKYTIVDIPSSTDNAMLTVGHAAFGYREQRMRSDTTTVDFKIDVLVKESSDEKITVVSKYGTHAMVGGVEMNITGHVFHGADVQTTATLRWPATESRPAVKHEIQVASDAFGNRESWVVAWRTDRAQLWVASSMGADPWLRAVDFSDPVAIIYFHKGRWVGQTTKNDEPSADIDASRMRSLLGEAADGAPPTDMMVAMSGVFPALKTPNDEKQRMRPSSVLVAEYDEQWVITGAVTDAGGQPMSGVMVGVRHPSSSSWIRRSQTKKDGVYKLEFSTDISRPSLDWLTVAPIFAGHFEKQFASHGKVRLNPLKLDERSDFDATLGKQSVVDFRMMPAAELKATLPKSLLSTVNGGTARLTWNATPNEGVHLLSANIEAGGFRLTELPVNVDAKLQLLDANAQSQIEFPAKFDAPGRHLLKIPKDADLAKSDFSIEREKPPVQVTIVKNQQSLPPPEDETAFGDLVQRWAESCQGNNTLAIKDHNPQVWQEVVTGYNVVHVVYDPPRKMKVHTDDGFVNKTVIELAFPMYEMRPGAIFAIVDGKDPKEKTLVLQSQLIQPSIAIVSHPALARYVSKWYQLRIDAWKNELPEKADAKNVATIDVAPGGALELNGNALPKDIKHLGDELAKAGYHRDTTCVLIRGTQKTLYEDLHWPMWKLWSMRWKDLVLRVSQPDRSAVSDN